MKSLIIALFFFSPLESHIYSYFTPAVHHLQPMHGALHKSGLQHVDCIYVINLDEREYKWLRMDAHLKSHGIIGNRFSAINGWKMSKEVLYSLAGPYPKERLTPGRSGCILSHLSVIKDALDRGFKSVWIMEDDILIKENPHQLDRLLAIIKQIDPGWDIFFTDLDSKDPTGKVVPSLGSDFRPDGIYPSLDYFTWRSQITSDLMRIRQRFGAYSYIVSRQGLQKIYDYLTHVYFWTAYDMDMHYTPNLVEYAAIRDIVTIWHDCVISDTTYPINSIKNRIQ